MDRNITALNFKFEADDVGSNCGVCGAEFDHPLLAMVFADSLVEEYYACPKCLSKVASFHPKKITVAEVDDAQEENETPVAKLEAAVESSAGEVAGCLHYLGYLKKRPKNTPIPEECLTCSKMIDCMY